MKYIKLFENLEYGKLGTDFFNVEVWGDYENGYTSFLLGSSKRKKNVYEQLKVYKIMIANILDKKIDVHFGNVKKFKILVNVVEIDDIDNWEVELLAKKYNI
jgi:hypothetical protein